MFMNVRSTLHHVASWLLLTRSDICRDVCHVPAIMQGIPIMCVNEPFSP